MRPTKLEFMQWLATNRTPPTYDSAYAYLASFDQAVMPSEEEIESLAWEWSEKTEGAYGLKNDDMTGQCAYEAGFRAALSRIKAVSVESVREAVFIEFDKSNREYKERIVYEERAKAQRLVDSVREMLSGYRKHEHPAMRWNEHQIYHNDYDAVMACLSEYESTKGTP